MAGIIEPSPYGPDDINLNYGLHFTGGEPFLNFDLLCEAVEMAEELNIPSTFVETNCFWAVNNKTTQEKLSILKNKGLKGILISVNPFFLEYIPFARTERAVKYGYELFGQNLIVYQSEYYKRFRSPAFYLLFLIPVPPRCVIAIHLSQSSFLVAELLGQYIPRLRRNLKVYHSLLTFLVRFRFVDSTDMPSEHYAHFTSLLNSLPLENSAGFLLTRQKNSNNSCCPSQKIPQKLNRIIL